MKYLSTILLLSFFTIVYGQKLDKSTRILLKSKMDSISVDDQKYRLQLMLGELDKHKLDSLNKLPFNAFWDRVNKVGRKEVGFSRQISDSLWNIQNRLDSLNANKFIEIINKYGYPSYKRTKSYTSSTISLHLIGKLYFDRLLPLFTSEQQKGNMPSDEFARWFDRNNLVSGKKQLFGEYNSKYPCVDNIIETNSERKKIGLKPLKKNNCK